MSYIWGDFGQRLQHEEPFVHMGMRHRQVHPASNQIAIEQYIQIDGARPVAYLADAAESLLNLQKYAQEFFRCQLRLQLGDGVEKISLSRRAANWRGLVIRRDLLDNDSGPSPQSLECPVEVLTPVAKVAAQGDICRHAHGRFDCRGRTFYRCPGDSGVWRNGFKRPIICGWPRAAFPNPGTAPAWIASRCASS